MQEVGRMGDTSGAASERPSFATRQREPMMLRLLVAMDRRYNRVKIARTAEVVFVVLLPCVSSVFASAKHGEYDVLAASAGLILTMLDVGFLYPFTVRQRLRGAQIQERFDSHVLGLALMESRTVGAPDLHEIAAGPGGAGEAIPSRFNDWYLPAFAQLRPSLDVLGCQLMNLVWDRNQRASYLNALVGLATAVGILFFALSVWRGYRFDDVVNGVLFPMLPALVWLFREVADQRETHERQQGLYELGMRLWTTHLHQPGAHGLRAGVEDLQGGIFWSRANSLPVPHAFYALLRDRYQKSAETWAADLIAQAR